jgi:hypothetical protein
LGKEVWNVENQLYNESEKMVKGYVVEECTVVICNNQDLASYDVHKNWGEISLRVAYVL